MSETIQLLADQIARRMAHKFAKRKGLREERGEEIIDHAAPLVWAQQLPIVPDALGEILAKATAIVCVQRAKALAYNELIAERNALAEWSARRQPRSVFVGDDGSGAPIRDYDAPIRDYDAPIRDYDALARLAMARAIGYTPLWGLNAYHA